MNSPPLSSEGLEITRHVREGVAVLALAGELDMATTPLLDEALEGFDWQGALVLDLGDLTFIDSHGLHAIFRRVDAGNLILARPHPNIVRVLRLTQGDRLVRVEDSLDTALEIAVDGTGQVGRVDAVAG